MSVRVEGWMRETYSSLQLHDLFLGRLALVAMVTSSSKLDCNSLTLASSVDYEGKEMGRFMECDGSTDIYLGLLSFR